MNHLYEQLTALKLTGFRDALKKQLAQPGTYQELGFEERLSLLTAEELTCRENRKAERLIKHARFRLNAELSKLDYPVREDSDVPARPERAISATTISIPRALLKIMR